MSITESEPVRVGELVVMEHPASLNQIVGRLSAYSSDSEGWIYHLETEDGSTISIAGNDRGDQKWRIRPQGGEWHPRQSSAIELRQRLMDVSWELMDVRQSMEFDDVFDLKPEFADENRRAQLEALREIERGIWAASPEGWRDRYLAQVESGWE